MHKLKRLLYQGLPFEDLHRNYATAGLLDPKGQLNVSSSIVIDAPIGLVWDIVYRMEKWPSFCPNITDVKLAMAVKADDFFSLNLNGFTINGKFAVVLPHTRLIWTGKSLWTKAIDRIELSPLQAARTQLTIAESLTGMFVSVLMSERRLVDQHELWLTAIKTKAENG